MLLSSLVAISGAPAMTPHADTSSDWHIKKLQFSAISMGVAMQDEKIGWSSFTNGASAISITKTTDGGDTWTPVAKQNTPLMIMGLDASTDPTLDVVVTGMAAASFSTDGTEFKASKGAPFISQSVKASLGGRVATAHDAGACISSDSGATFKCFPVPFKYGPLGRYVSSPSADVIYITSGMWPTASKRTKEFMPITANLRMVDRHFETGGSRMALEMGPFPLDAPRAGDNTTTYVAELWKSADGGKTWKSLVSDEGNFYFNDIDCIDETHCVAVGEGFGKDGSKSPGARVYVTSDGETFKLAHHETVDGSSLMAAKMISTMEHHAGGLLQGGVTLHSKDGGATYVKEGATITGQMITSMSFPTPEHAFATTVNQLQISSLLEYNRTAA